jgi:ABC-type lipoprotein release transport system permease subunit
MPPDTTVFELNGTTLAGIGAVLGTLIGGITFLFKALIAAKDRNLSDKDEQIEQLIKDRDYWRDYALTMVGPAEKALTMAEESTRRIRRAS